MNPKRWSGLMNAWGLPANDETFAALTSAYGERHRHYHTGRHVRSCLAHLDECLPRISDPEEVELALWFHDAIYNPLSGKNERKSADWASSFLRDNGAPQDKVARVDRLIMVTKHDAETTTADEALLVDIDLAILGADPGTYASFEDAIRQEYRLIPTLVYRRKRAQLLQTFLGRPSIYRNALFQERWEEAARANLQGAIATLGRRG